MHTLDTRHCTECSPNITSMNTLIPKTTWEWYFSFRGLEALLTSTGCKAGRKFGLKSSKHRALCFSKKHCYIAPQTDHQTPYEGTTKSSMQSDISI